MSAKLQATLASLALAFSFAAGWAVNGWRLSGQNAKELVERDRQALVVAEQRMAIGRNANVAISTADMNVWKGLEDDKKELDRLRSCVAAGTCGVRIITKYVPIGSGPSDPGAGSVGYDTIEIDPDVQRRVLDHREAISEDQRKIEFLQEYARTCFELNL